jgi:hypothetical protein
MRAVELQLDLTSKDLLRAYLASPLRGTVWNAEWGVIGLGWAV